MFALLFYVTLFFLLVALLYCAIYVSRFNDACAAELVARSQRDIWMGRHETLSKSFDNRTTTIAELKEDRTDLRRLLELRGEEISKLNQDCDDLRQLAKLRGEELASLKKTQRCEGKWVLKPRDPNVDDKEIEKLQDDIAAFVKITDSWVEFSKRQTARIASLETAAQNDAELRKKLRSEVKSLKEKIGIANAL